MIIKTFLKKPKTIGCVAQSSPFLSDAMANLIKNPKKDFVLEVGAGLGAITKSIINKGVYEDRLTIIELEKSFCKILKRNFPLFNIICGDICKIKHQLSKVDTIISGLPLKNFPKDKNLEIYEIYKSLLKKDGQILQFTYGMLPPIDYKKLGINGKREKFIARNLPPAFVWRFFK